jgi:hypothetical protein
MSALLAGCSSQTNSGTSGNAPAIVDIGNGCKIDTARICAGVRGHEIVMSNTGLSADHHMVEQNSASSAPIFVTLRGPNAESIAEVRCVLNGQDQSVRYSSMMPGPAVSEEGAKYLRAQSYCAET